MSDNILEIRGLNKHFDSTHANKDIDFNVKCGEIRGLIGENGSGKSTLISQIAGIYGYDSGEMRINGEFYRPRNPIDGNKHGIAVVMQELGVVSSLPGVVNVFLGHTDQFAKCGLISFKKMYQAANEQFEKWGLSSVPLNRMMDGMSIESRKLVELARALAVEPDILILDEVTQSLSLNNRQMLYELIRKFKEKGRSVICITHDVDELISITDTITVLRDGAVVGTVVSAESSVDEIKQMMVGRKMTEAYYRTDMTPDYSDQVVLEVKGLSVSDRDSDAFEHLTDISFELHKGEILGFCGLSDSGIHTLGKAVYGLEKLSEGTVTLTETGFRIRKPRHALRRNMGYVPKDRDREALMINASVRENLCMTSVSELSGPIGFLSPAKLRKLSEKTVEDFSVKCRDIYQSMSALSGGNKQKVNLGRWLTKDIRILILDCPTRGVDVGVKAYIYELMKEAKKKDISIILISDELTEILGMADRLFVMKNGAITREIRRDEDFTEQSVIRMMI